MLKKTYSILRNFNKKGGKVNKMLWIIVFYTKVRLQGLEEMKLST